jgi:hypothetical protein
VKVGQMGYPHRIPDWLPKRNEYEEEDRYDMHPAYKKPIAEWTMLELLYQSPGWERERLRERWLRRKEDEEKEMGVEDDDGLDRWGDK